MRRRDLLSMMALAPAIPARMAVAQEKAERATRGLPSPKIKDVSVIATQPGGSRLVVVKITTDQAGLYGYGCATFTQRADLVDPAVEKYLRPFLIGKARRPHRRHLADAATTRSYWRNGAGAQQRHERRRPGAVGHQGPHGRHAGLSIVGRQGARGAATLTASVGGGEIPQVIEAAQHAMSQGYLYVRMQIGVPGMAATVPAAAPPLPKSRRSMSGPSSNPVPTFAAR